MKQYVLIKGNIYNYTHKDLTFGSPTMRQVVEDLNKYERLKEDLGHMMRIASTELLATSNRLEEASIRLGNTANCMLGFSKKFVGADPQDNK